MSLPTADFGSSVQFFFDAAGPVLRKPGGHLLGGNGGCSGLPAGDVPGPRPRLAERARRRLSEGAGAVPGCHRRLPGRRRDQRFIPARVGDATKIFLTKGQIRHSTYPGDHLIVLRPVGLRHLRRTARLRLRTHPGPAATTPRAARAARLRHRLLGPEPAAPAVHDHRARHRLRGHLRDRRPPRRGVLGADQAGGGDPQRAEALPARGRVLAGRSAGSSALPPSGSSSRRSGSAARFRT